MDSIRHAVILLAPLSSSYRILFEKDIAGLAVLGCLISFILLSPETVKSKMSTNELKSSKEEEKSITDKLANRDFTYLLFFMALIARLDIFIALTAAGSNIFAGVLLYNKIKTAS